MPRIYELHAKVYDNNSGQMIDTVVDYNNDSAILNTEMQNMISYASAISGSGLGPPALPDGRLVDLSSFVVTSTPLQPPPKT